MTLFFESPATDVKPSDTRCPRILGGHSPAPITGPGMLRGTITASRAHYPRRLFPRARQRREGKHRLVMNLFLEVYLVPLINQLPYFMPGGRDVPLVESWRTISPFRSVSRNILWPNPSPRGMSFFFEVGRSNYVSALVLSLIHI